MINSEFSMPGLVLRVLQVDVDCLLKLSKYLLKRSDKELIISKWFNKIKAHLPVYECACLCVIFGISFKDSQALGSKRTAQAGH